MAVVTEEKAPHAPLDQAFLEDVGRRLIAESARYRRRPDRRLQDLSMKTVAAWPELRAALFRLVDVAPACSDKRDLARHLAALLREVESPAVFAPLLRRAAGARSTRGLVGGAAGLAVRAMAGRFIIGESIEEAIPALTGMWERGIGASIDLLGEATVTAEEAEVYTRRCEEVLEGLAAAAREWPSRPRLENDSIGPLPRVNLSVKLSAMTPEARPDDPDRGARDAGPRLRRLLRLGKRHGAHIHIDMESLDSREMVLRLIEEILGDDEFEDGPSIGMVLQAYLRDSDETAERMLAAAAESKRRDALTIRLVKGAYWDHEGIVAEGNGWSVPVFTEKADSDRSFERLTRRLIDAHPIVRPAIASHNIRSIAHAVAYAEARGMGRTEVEYQVLRGLGDDLGAALAAAGLRTRVYCPIGDLVAGMAYLVRRLLENTANDSFLLDRARSTDVDRLLRAP